ncbi:hypothetical protein [Natronosalvus caseinilyticus]|uniref:hypothetical protein n=1 Tax=Natronosalvus caseinilyticus TaxID=2953747 RepID=UPI0028AC1B10|nr:hypothetical protein [Natronosalvus caseinilyticus]
MSTSETQQANPFENPMVRYALGLSGAAIIAFVAIVYLEGLARYLALGLAILDAVLMPKFLEYALEAEETA